MNINTGDNVLGLSFGYHDSAVCKLGRELLIAEHEERFTRIKNDKSFPRQSLHWLASTIGLEDVKSVAFYENPNLKRRRLIQQLLGDISVGKLPSKNFLKKLLLVSNSAVSNFLNHELGVLGCNASLSFVGHHESHAATAFFTSQFRDAAIVVMDGVGERACTSIFDGNINSLKLMEEVYFPNSLGLFYAALAAFCGFKVNSGEYKFMGLAPYGSPVYRNHLENHFIQLDNSGKYLVNARRLGLNSLRGFDFQYLESVFGRAKRLPQMPLTQFHADLASSVQSILDDAVVNLARYAIKITGKNRVALSGGVALNCVANGKLSKVLGEENLHVFSASGDSGSALGAAALVYARGVSGGDIFRLKTMGSKLGRKFSKRECQEEIARQSLPYKSLSFEEGAAYLQEKIMSRKIVAIFSGRSEFGPRALGNRSILADARILNGQIHINEKIKFRESFRPFAPIVLWEEAHKYFDLELPSEFMTRVVQVRDFSMERQSSNLDSDSVIEIASRLAAVSTSIPSVTHLDGSARVQTISNQEKGITRRVLEKFFEATGCPVLVNTSFNVRGEPIVGTPFDAINCFMTTEIDLLWLEGLILDKSDLSPEHFSNFTLKVSQD